MRTQNSIINKCLRCQNPLKDKQYEVMSYGENYSTAPVHTLIAPRYPSTQTKKTKIQVTQPPILLIPMKQKTIDANRLAQLSLLMTDKITKSLDQLIMEKMQCSQYFQHGAIISLISCLMKVFQVCYVSDMPYSHFHSRHINYSSHFQLLNPRMNSIPQNDHLTKQVFNTRHRKDLFTIGCIILEACTLTLLPTIYDYDRSIMDEDIEERLRLCLDRYHPSIIQFLSMIIKLKNSEVCEQAIKFHKQRLSILVIKTQRVQSLISQGHQSSQSGIQGSGFQYLNSSIIQSENPQPQIVDLQSSISSNY